MNIKALKIILLVICIMLVFTLHILEGIPTYIKIIYESGEEIIVEIRTKVVNWFGFEIPKSIIYDLAFYTFIFIVVFLIYLEIKELKGGGKP